MPRWIPLCCFANVVLPVTALPLFGPPAVVWLEGAIGRSLPVRVLLDCYVADTQQKQLQIVCLD